MAALGITRLSCMNGWQYARNGVLTLSAISYFNVIAGRVCVWHISIWWSLCFSTWVWDIWRRYIFLKEKCKTSLRIYDVWLYEYMVIYNLFDLALCLSRTRSTSIHYCPTGSHGNQVIDFLSPGLRPFSFIWPIFNLATDFCFLFPVTL